jgi:hypothetical protein
MLKWAIAWLMDRLTVMALVMFVIHTYGAAGCESAGQIRDWLNRVSSLDDVLRALQLRVRCAAQPPQRLRARSKPA